MEHEENNDSALVLLSVMSKTVVIVLAVLAFAIPSAFLLLGIFWRSSLKILDSPAGCFLFSIVLAMYLAVFFFVLWPRMEIGE